MEGEQRIHRQVELTPEVMDEIDEQFRNEPQALEMRNRANEGIDLGSD